MNCYPPQVKYWGHVASTTASSHSFQVSTPALYNAFENTTPTASRLSFTKQYHTALYLLLAKALGFAKDTVLISCSLYTPLYLTFRISQIPSPPHLRIPRVQKTSTRINICLPDQPSLLSPSSFWLCLQHLVSIVFLMSKWRCPF